MVTAVENAMMPEPLTLDADMTLPDAAERMRLWHVDDVFVVDGPRLCGLLTARHIVVTAIASGRHPATITAGECCERDHPAIQANAPTSHAVALMADHGLQRLPVLDDHGHLIGTIWASDLPAADRG